MNNAEAIEILRKVMNGIQHARSVGRESMGKNPATISGKAISPEIVDAALEDITPWLYGEKGDAFLKGVIDVVERKKVTGMEFYNFMYVLQHLEPTMGQMVSALADIDLPELTYAWIGDLR